MVNGFNLWVGLGASLGLWSIWRSAPPRQARAWLNAGLLLLVAALAGARLFYSFQNWSYFAGHPLEILQLSSGGLAWPGAAAGYGLALVGMAASYSLRAGKRAIPSPFGLVGDRTYPLLPPLSAAIWLGCWQVGAAYGALAPEGAWWAGPMLDETGVFRQRFLLQPAAALTLLLLFGLLEARVQPLCPPGRRFILAAAGLLLHTLAATLLIASPAPTWNGLRVDTWFAAGCLAALTVLALIQRLRGRYQQKTLLPGL
jgi:hypothetical protein